MMEHQDYETIPDDQFERLSRKLHIKEKWRPMVSYLIRFGVGDEGTGEVPSELRRSSRSPWRR